MGTGKFVEGLCLIAGVAVGLAACGSETFEVLADEERAIETAEDIVAQITQAYADMYWEGEVYTVTLDETTSAAVKDAPELRDGFRHVAERLPEEAPWILKVSETYTRGSTTVLLVMVYDFYHPHLCCKVMSADLVREDGGWRITEVKLGGFNHETEEGREKRLARGAELREREVLR